MTSDFGGLEADGAPLQEFGFAVGSLVDSSDMPGGSIVEKSTSHVLVERDKARRGATGY